MIKKTAIPVYNIARQSADQWVWERYVSHGADKCDILIREYTVYLIEAASIEYRRNRYFRYYITNSPEGISRLKHFFCLQLAKLPHPKMEANLFDQIMNFLVSWA